ncbi:MAG: superoxide dismutase [Planctomycetota bacterium]
MAHQLPDLPYDYSALEPHIDAQTMQIHHGRHHQAYVNNLNAAEEQLAAALEKGDYQTAVKLTGAVNFNGGGHANHSLFWKTMSPKGGGNPSGELAGALDAAFGTFARFQEAFSAQSVAIQGSGWGWLCFDPTSRALVIQATGNQDNPVKLGLKPILGLDVWEHAYYLRYQNKRPDYVKAWWNVVDWAQVADNFAKAKA